MTLVGERLCVEGRRVNRPFSSVSGLVEKGAGGDMSVCERFILFGGARGPPGMDGLAVMLMGRRVGCGGAFVNTFTVFPLLPF